MKQHYFRGNQYVTRTGRFVKNLAVGIALSPIEMYRNPKWVGFGIATLALAVNVFSFTAPTHPATLLVKDAWADLVSTDQVYVKEVSDVSDESPAAVMERIAKCESGGTHYKKDGTLVKNINKNGTIDVGKYQINSAWEAKARSMGMDIYLPEGNEQFAYWLYDQNAAEDWYPSRSCWQRK